uniref:Amino Acid/Auxin Permease (AAAP) Family putative n=1 Tax=Albugo laibachii Nc14 TaxID=890382 RepID=F0W742_9STRA|nr:Amino Acid/Auxin Permease (AAAP) Family putative [Albugo laibachii Nc14]|eukprot:CCA16941.1 Amino Acid/Auxin Permease (AAAP) Family putative [Albugo laibachii Nc14]
MGKALWTLEDSKIAFSIFCCVYGIGTLGMPGNFSRVGPVIATCALAFMAAANIYSSIVLSKIMLCAPRSVRTFGDLGDWCMNRTGRYLVVLFQITDCLLMPCAYLVLGGTLLKNLFPGTFEQSTWILLMAFAVLPVCLTPTMKEGAFAALAGCSGTILADFISVGVLLHGMSGHPEIPRPDLSFDQIAGTFGNLSLAYGAGVVIPALQRQHSDPTRMPRIITVTLVCITCLFLTLAGSGYSAVGCQISGNLLFSIFPDHKTGLSALGVRTPRGAAVMAFLGVQFHITIAFSVLIHPAFFTLERSLLGMHRNVPCALDDIEKASHYGNNTTPSEGTRISKKRSFISIADIEQPELFEDEALEYQGPNTIKYIILRVVVVAILVMISVFFREHFGEFADFIGASCITMSCIVLPIVFYLYKLGDQVPLYEKIVAVTIAVICFSFGAYVTYQTGRELFTRPDHSIKFPFCAPRYKNDLYYNSSLVH